MQNVRILVSRRDYARGIITAYTALAKTAGA